MELTEPYEQEALQILRDFLPDRIFDAHAHIYDSSCLWDWPRTESFTTHGYREDMREILGEPKTLKINMIAPCPRKPESQPECGTLTASEQYILRQLETDPDAVGQILVYPGESAEHIASRLTHPRIVGIKCYHSLLQQPNTFQAGIDEYLPESAWEVAQEKKCCITVHMVRDKALSDPGNMAYIKTMAARYPDAKLVLAHAARSFAAWTGLESVTELAGYENIWFDLAAVCESPVTFQILKKVSKERCMWGTDYPLVLPKGKVFSLADSFYWLYQRDIDRFQSNVPIHAWPIAVENLMAARQACIMADLTRKEVEDLFYNNAERLFEKEGT